MIIPTTCWMPVSFSVNFVFHWDFAVSWDLQIPLITVTKDGLLINSTAVLSVKKKSISEEADCFPLSSPTWQSFSNGDRVVFQWEGKRLEEHHHCWNHSAGLGHPSLKEKTGALSFFHSGRSVLKWHRMMGGSTLPPKPRLNLKFFCISLDAHKYSNCPESRTAKHP